MGHSTRLACTVACSCCARCCCSCTGCGVFTVSESSDPLVGSLAETSETRQSLASEGRNSDGRVPCHEHATGKAAQFYLRPSVRPQKRRSALTSLLTALPMADAAS
eukprot:516108-Pleurochrysis_carterae.AAC.1